ncbi:MAG: hypothetical protein R3B13_23635 [Polyangiaceae bacterium]
MKQTTAAIAASLVLSGCFTTTVRSGQPPAREALYDAWHDGYLAGLIESDGPYDLSRSCPEGWAEITTELQPLQTLVTVVTLMIYSPQSVTIVCAAPGAPRVPPHSGYAPGDPGYPPRPPAGIPLPPASGDPEPEETQNP